MDPWYCTREEVKAALDVQSPARNDRRIDRAITSARDAIQGRLQRRFAPMKDTRTKDWPIPRQTGPWWQLWLGDDECTELTAVVSGGITLSPDEFFLRPDNAAARGESFTLVEINLAENGSWTAAATWQRSISLTGTFAATAPVLDAVAELDGVVNDTAATVTVTDGSQVGVGSLLQLDDEWCVVTGRRQVATTDTLAAGLSASKADQLVPVADGATWQVDETVVVDGETMLITNIVGDQLVVLRAWDGTTLAAHDEGATLYTPRALLVDRGQRGTTAASHADGTAVAVWQVPDLINQLAVAQSLVTVSQTRAGYPMPVSNRSGTSQSSTSTTPARPVSRPSDLSDLWDQACTRYGQPPRTGAVI